MVTVKAANRFYRMTKDQAAKLLDMASEMVPCGIYAVEKKDYLELRNDPMSRTKLREARRHYKKLGFKVYANAG